MTDDKPGATGKFPEGKLNPTDEGELQIMLGISQGCVKIEFGKPVAWFAMGGQDAIELGIKLCQLGHQLGGQLPANDAKGPLA